MSEIVECIEALKSRAANIVQLATRVRSRLNPETITVDDKSIKYIETIGSQFTISIVAAFENLQALPIDKWTDEHILELLMDIPSSYDVSKKELAQSVRIALTGYTVSEPIEQVIRLIGKDNTLKQLKLWIGQIFLEESEK